MSAELGVRLNETTPVGQVLKANKNSDGTWTLVTRGEHDDEGAEIVIDLAHESVHTGTHYFYDSAQDLTNGQTVSFVLVVPDTVYVPHFELYVDGEAEYGVNVYEGATPGANGTLVTNPGIYNRNRNFPDTNGVKIYSTPTLAPGSKGALLASHHTGRGIQSGGEDRPSREIVLRRNTKYWIDFINATANNNYIDWLMDWYEREP